jgi:hypothetical protein
VRDHQRRPAEGVSHPERPQQRLAWVPVLPLIALLVIAHAQCQQFIVVRTSHGESEVIVIIIKLLALPSSSSEGSHHGVLLLSPRL